MLIAQITDLHVRRKGDLLHHMVRTGRDLRRCLAAIHELVPQPSLIVATGDLVDRGKSKEYRRLRACFAHATIPVYLVPGNHDDRDALRDAFPDHRYLPQRGPLCYVVESRPLRLVAVDSVRAGRKPGGELDEERLHWLDEVLRAAPAVPTVIAMHHPPFRTGIAAFDRQGFKGAEALAALIAAHPQVVRIAGGHVHRAFAVPFAGTVASTAPSTAHQLVLDQDGSGYSVRLERPSFALHRWTGRDLVSEVRTLADREQRPRLRTAS